MANQGTPIVISGATFYVPTQSESAPWGDDLHDTVVALAEAVASTSGSSGIPLTTFQLANNQSSSANLTGFSFDVSQVRSFIAQYSLYRATSISEESEVGTIYGTYSSVAATWDFSPQLGGSSTISFSITSGGQVQYTSGNLSGSSYQGQIKFMAVVFLQV